MSEINYNINLDYDPENEELAVILNNADNFCNALELADIYFDSIKICIDSPKHYRICKREAPLKITVPIQEDDWDEDDEEEFFDADIVSFFISYNVTFLPLNSVYGVSVSDIYFLLAVKSSSPLLLMIKSMSLILGNVPSTFKT